MPTCPIIREKDFSRIDHIMKKVELKLYRDGIIKSRGGSKTRGGEKRGDLILFLFKVVVVFHEIYESRDYTINDVVKCMMKSLRVSKDNGEEEILMYLFSNPIYIIILVAYIYYNSSKTKSHALANAIIAGDKTTLHDIVENERRESGEKVRDSGSGSDMPELETFYENNSHKKSSMYNPIHTNNKFRYTQTSHGIYKDARKKKGGKRRRSTRRIKKQYRLW